MRAIKIDPSNRTISEIRLTRNPNYTFDELYEIIDCSVADFVLIDKEIVMISDKEPDKKQTVKLLHFWGVVCLSSELPLFSVMPIIDLRHCRKTKYHLSR